MQKFNPCDISIIDASFEESGTSVDVSDDVAKDTLTILREVVNCLDTTHKNKLNDLLSELYVEASAAAPADSAKTPAADTTKKK